MCLSSGEQKHLHTNVLHIHTKPMERSLCFIGNCILIHDPCLVAAHALERMMSPIGPSPNPNVPSEYCSTIPPLQQARAAGTLNSPPPTVMVPVSVLKNPNHDGTWTLKYRTHPLRNHRSFFPPPRPLTPNFLLSFVFQVVPVNRSAFGLLTASSPMERWQTRQSCQ